MDIKSAWNVESEMGGGDFELESEHLDALEMFDNHNDHYDAFDREDDLWESAENDFA